MTIDFAEGLQRNRADGRFAFTSVRSAHPDILAASLRLAEKLDVPIVVAATSNPVKPFGGNAIPTQRSHGHRSCGLRAIALRSRGSTATSKQQSFPVYG